MGKIIFVRHGQPDDYDKNGKRLGSTNSGLTERGRSEARKAGEVIKSVYNPTCIFSSTAVRAYQTARLINEEIGKSFEIEEIGIDEEMWPDILQKPIPPNATQETIDKIIVSLTQAYAEAKRTLNVLQSKQNNGDIVLVTHGYRMVMIHWALLYDKQPTIEECLDFWNNNCYEPVQCQHPNTRFCKMFAVSFNAEKSQQIEYPYQISIDI